MDEIGYKEETMPLKITRFINLVLASMITGNAIGSLTFVFPALHELDPQAKTAAEQALTRRYLPIMRVLMPATVVSCLAVLGMMRDRQSAAFRLTLAGTAGFVGMLGITAIELPINKQTLEVAPESPPADWPDTRARWERFNRLRTLCEVIGWACLYLGALSPERSTRRYGL
jgi:uncharacterized membrane protein